MNKITKNILSNENKINLIKRKKSFKFLYYLTFSKTLMDLLLSSPLSVAARRFLRHRGG